MALKPKTATPVVIPDLPTYLHGGPEPFDHQKRAFARSRDMDVFGLLWEVGTAKTKPMIDTAGDMFERGKIDTLLVVAPNGVHRQWVMDELPAHMPSRIPFIGGYFRAGTANKSWKSAMAAGNDRLRVLSVNQEVFSFPRLLGPILELCAKSRVLAEVDESHNFKTPSASRTRNLWKLTKLTEARRILTGTEISTGIEDLYAQFRFLDPSIIGCHTYAEFKARYCITAGPYDQIVNYRNVEELQRRIAPYVDIAYKKDCLDLPEFLPLEVDVELTDAQKKAYHSIKQRYLAELDSGSVIEAPMAINRLQRFRQIAAGHVQLGGGDWEPLPCEPRLQKCVELVKQAKGKVIVWSDFVPSIEQLAEAFVDAGISFVTYYGGNSSGTNAKNLDKFKTDPSVKVWLANPSTGSEGLTINQATTMIWYQLGVSYLEFTQGCGRNHRPGQTESVTCHMMVAPKTVETKLYKALMGTKKLAEIFKDPRAFRRWLLEDDIEEEATQN